MQRDTGIKYVSAGVTGVWGINVNDRVVYRGYDDASFTPVSGKYDASFTPVSGRYDTSFTLASGKYDVSSTPVSGEYSYLH